MALQSFYGIGKTTANNICSKLQIHGRATVASLNETKLNSLSAYLAEMKLENDLRRRVQADILHHREIGNYRGGRHAAGYPVNGQNTRNNALSARRLNRIPRRG